jgi:hypothetical protein
MGNNCPDAFRGILALKKVNDIVLRLCPEVVDLNWIVMVQYSKISEN